MSKVYKNDVVAIRAGASLWRKATEEEIQAWRDSDASKGMNCAGETKLHLDAVLLGALGVNDSLPTGVEGGVVPGGDFPPAACAAGGEGDAEWEGLAHENSLALRRSGLRIGRGLPVESELDSGDERQALGAGLELNGHVLRFLFPAEAHDLGKSFGLEQLTGSQTPSGELWKASKVDTYSAWNATEPTLIIQER